MNTEFESNFVVMPVHANYMYPMIFGGAFYSELDLCAATCVNRFLYNSECASAVTHISEVKFLAPCYVGDLIYIKAKIDQDHLGKKSIPVIVTAFRERRRFDAELVVEAKFVFVSILHAGDVASKPVKLPYHPHGLQVEK